MIRRLVDITVAVPALLVLCPVVLAVAVAVRLDSPGKTFYGGPRMGKGGKRFRIWKFRTMVVNAKDIGPGITATNDPRITRIGKLLRRTKIDELPQFWNLLVGDITLVGPRAEDPDIVARYTPAQRWVLSVTPGITSPGTLFYARHQEATIPTGQSAEDYYLQHLLDRKLQIDLDYLRARTALSDTRVVLETAWHVVRSLPFGRIQGVQD